ncbi:hypothetical protein [Amycolatopsis thermophila]|uniref:Uncharacterized protein n=1 Tax=Amycolatopsis thermophila TaxID=206084 RepID=A0ABU0F5I2_9PSEU|nr:hypothetical protein [Amycolatopsis thermophila]MDQ0382847.1 hypothetical protein [Amycolatopsis thermophila]
MLVSEAWERIDAAAAEQGHDDTKALKSFVIGQGRRLRRLLPRSPGNWSVTARTGGLTGRARRPGTNS